MPYHPGLRWLASVIGAPIPPHMKHLFDGVLMMLVIDSLSGWWKSHVCADRERPRLFLRFLTAILQATLLLSIAGATCMALDSWIELEGACWILISIISLSLLRTLVALQLCGGMDFGPAKPLLDRLGSLLLVEKVGQASGEGAVKGRMLPFPVPKEEEDPQGKVKT